MDDNIASDIKAHVTAEHDATRALLSGNAPLVTVDADQKTGIHAKINIEQLSPRQRLLFLVAAGVASSVIGKLIMWFSEHGITINPH